MCEELQNCVWSIKWSMNPSKLAAFTWNELIPDEAKKYAYQIIDEEMPQGLKKYLEVELFPQIHMKVGKGVSLTTAHHWLHHEGFHYMQYWKAIYFNGQIDLMFWVTSRSISYLPCKNTDLEWLNTKLARLRQKSVNN